MTKINLENGAMDFLKEIDHELETIENLIMDLQRGNSTPEILREVSRTLHSLKGNSGSYNLVYISSACHKFENLISNFDFVPKEKMIEDFLDLKDMIENLSSAYKNQDQKSLLRIKEKMRLDEVEVTPL